ncbi:Dynein regulatory complex subunit 7 [Chlorella vulgaris]
MASTSIADRLAEASGGTLNLSHLGAAALEDALSQALGLRIVELNLSSNELDADTLPVFLPAIFPRLRVLRLKYNKLASLPLAAIERLAYLEHLELDGNQITAVDEAVLASLPASLRRLSLSSNGVSRLPDGLGVTCCRALTHLNVSNNPLVELPDSLGSCPMLTHLDVSSCRLKALPASLAQAPSLQRLFCQNNELTCVPTAFGRQALKEWNLRSNRLPPLYEQAKERGLAKFLAFLREEEEVERQQEIERNRPVGLPAGPCTAFRCKAVLDDAVAAAQAGEPCDGFAWIRHGYAVCQQRNSIFVWGGVVVREGRKTSELLVLNLDVMEWRVQPTRGERPCPRDGHCMVADDSGRHLLVFGGRREAGGRRLSELHFLDLSSFTWFAPKIPAAAAPPPREQCSAAFARGRLLIFGGRTNGTRLNDLWAFDMLNLLWEQLLCTGIAPSPRQSAAACVSGGQLWVMGGQANFVLDDLFTLSLETQEWQAVTIAGRSKAAARAGGHSITVHEGTPFMFGGMDALGAHVSQLLKLKRIGPARFEWVETELSLMPNRSRISGHPVHQLTVDSDQIDGGGVIWDVTLVAPLAEVQDKVVREDASSISPKRERVRHAMLMASKLPPPYTRHTPREQQLLAAADAFCARWQADPCAAGRLPPCVSLLNECGVQKTVCTTLRPTQLPHIDLQDLDTITQFVAEFVKCEPLELSDKPPSHLISPASLLDWQAGDSFDLATLACSLLLGAGYSAFVVVGYTSKQVALGDQSRSICPWVERHGLVAPPYAELVHQEESFEAETEQRCAGTPLPAGLQGAEQVPPAAGEAPAVSSPHTTALATSGNNIQVAEAGDEDEGQQAPGTANTEQRLLSRPPTGHPPEAIAVPAVGSPAPAPTNVVAVGPGAADGKCSVQAAADEQAGAAGPAPAGCRRSKQYIHAFVLLKPGRRDVSRPLLLDPCTGCLYSPETAPCSGVEFAWDATNFWCNLQRGSGSGGGNMDSSVRTDGDAAKGDAAVTGSCDGVRLCPHGLVEPALMDWTFSNPNCWAALLVSKEDQHMETASIFSSGKLSGDGATLPKFGSSRLARQPSIISTRAQSPRISSFTGSPSPCASLSAAAAVQGSGGCATPSAGASQGRGAAGGMHPPAPVRRTTPRLGSWSHPRGDAADSSLAYLSVDSSAPPAGAAAGAAGAAAPLVHSSLALQPEMPLSWVPALAVSRERLDSRCPRGEKAVQYRQARRELYARYGDCQRWDGLVERLTTYSDGECSEPLCVLEVFERRQDKLTKRLVQPAQRSSTVSFAPGAAFCLRSVATIRPPAGQQGGELELEFYSESRADGLAKRTCSSSGMQEWFQPSCRSDTLLHRSVRYSAVQAAAAPTAFQTAIRKTSDAAAIAAAAGAASSAASLEAHGHRSSVSAAWDANERTLASIHEQYCPPAAPAGAAPGAVLERRFELAASQLQVVVLGPKGASTDDKASGTVTRTYDLGGYLLLQNEAGARRPSSHPATEEQRREYVALRAASGAAQAAVRAAEEETQGILASRQRQEQGTQLVATSFYDVTRLKVEDSEGVEGPGGPIEDEDAYDYLKHFLPSTGARDMTAAEALDAQAACLAAFDDRMAERQRMLAARVAESSAEVARLGSVLSWELQHLSPAEQARVREEAAAEAFRLQVAQQRADGYPTSATRRREELERKLTTDRRLAVALAAGD